MEGLERVVGDAALRVADNGHVEGRSRVGHVRRKSDHKPKFTHGAAIFIFDFVVKQKLFNFFLLLRCVPLMAVTVYGYDNTVSLDNSIYKAETKCTSTHNCGQVASDTACNMAFYSRLSAAVSGKSPVFDVNSLVTGLPACMAAAGPTERLKFFKTFA